MKKRIFYTEIAFFAGLILLALGTALTAKGGFGLSMVVAPAYLFHMLGLWPWLSFGIAEYILQAVVLLLLIIIMGKVRVTYLLSFLSTVIYGAILDFFMNLLEMVNAEPLWMRLVLYVFGALLCCLSISLLFRSYLPPAAYELFVKCISKRFGKPLHICKTIYDISSLAIAVLMSLLFFDAIRGVGIGTVVCAILYGVVIQLFGRLFDKCWHFQDKLPFRKFFEERGNAQ